MRAVSTSQVRTQASERLARAQRMRGGVDADPGGHALPMEPRGRGAASAWNHAPLGSRKLQEVIPPPGGQLGAQGVPQLQRWPRPFWAEGSVLHFHRLLSGLCPLKVTTLAQRTGRTGVEA